MQTQDIIVRPIVTERTSELKDRFNLVSFEVMPEANKHQIRSAVEQTYGVTVLAVRTSMVPGKVKRRGQAIKKRPNWKKAFVTLKEGDNIDFFAQE